MLTHLDPNPKEQRPSANPNPLTLRIASRGRQRNPLSSAADRSESRAPKTRPHDTHRSLALMSCARVLLRVCGSAPRRPRGAARPSEGAQPAQQDAQHSVGGLYTDVRQYVGPSVGLSVICLIRRAVGRRGVVLLASVPVAPPVCLIPLARPQTRPTRPRPRHIHEGPHTRTRAPVVKV